MSNKNSNFPPAQQPKLTPQEMKEQLLLQQEIYKLPPCNHDDPEELESRIQWYFNWAAENGVRPTYTFLALAIGVTRQALWQWVQSGSRKGKQIERAKVFLEALTESWGLNGKINPAAFCFVMKNNFQWSDTYSLEAVPATNNKLDSLPTRQEIAKRMANTDPAETEIGLDSLLDE